MNVRSLCMVVILLIGIFSLPTTMSMTHEETLPRTCKIDREGFRARGLSGKVQNQYRFIESLRRSHPTLRTAKITIQISKRPKETDTGHKDEVNSTKNEIGLIVPSACAKDVVYKVYRRPFKEEKKKQEKCRDKTYMVVTVTKG